MAYSNRIAGTLEKIIEEVNVEMPNVVDRMILYGSYARGDYTRESDIDIMLLMNCGNAEVKSYQDVACRIASRIDLEDDIEVSFTMQDKKTFEERLSILPFYRNVAREGVTIYES